MMEKEGIPLWRKGGTSPEARWVTTNKIGGEREGGRQGAGQRVTVEEGMSMNISYVL